MQPRKPFQVNDYNIIVSPNYGFEPSNNFPINLAKSKRKRERFRGWSLITANTKIVWKKEQRY